MAITSVTISNTSSDLSTVLVREKALKSCISCISDECLTIEKAAMAKNKRVSFSNIEIKEYPIIPDVNPAVTRGVPIAIDWDPINEVSCSVDEYEESRPTPRSQVELRMPATHRNDLLRRLGFSHRDILESVKEANLARNRRVRTMETMQLEPAQAAFERMTRAALNATLRRGKKAEEKKLLHDFAAGKIEKAKEDQDLESVDTYPSSDFLSAEPCSQSLSQNSEEQGENSQPRESTKTKRKKIPNSVKKKMKQQQREQRQMMRALK